MSGVLGAEVWFVPAEERFKARLLRVPDGDLTLECAESMLSLDCVVVRHGFWGRTFEDRSFREKKPILAGGWLMIRGACLGSDRQSAIGLGCCTGAAGLRCGVSRTRRETGN